MALADRAPRPPPPAGGPQVLEDQLLREVRIQRPRRLEVGRVAPGLWGCAGDQERQDGGPALLDFLNQELCEDVRHDLHRGGVADERRPDDP
eukprot:9046678-Pyramimonas_sp.AAC.1